MLTEAEGLWAPADDPIFQLVPPPFQEVVNQCYKDLGCPPVTFDTFWEVYITLRDSVEAAISPSIVTSLSQSIFSEHEGEEEEFAMGHMKAPEFDSRNVIEVEDEEDVDEAWESVYEDEEGVDDDEEGVDEDEEGVYEDEEGVDEYEEWNSEEEDLMSISFTADGDKDQLY